MRTLMLSTLALGALTAAAPAEPVTTAAPAEPIAPPAARTGPVTLTDAQMDRVTAGAEFVVYVGEALLETGASSPPAPQYVLTPAWLGGRGSGVPRWPADGESLLLR